MIQQQSRNRCDTGSVQKAGKSRRPPQLSGYTKVTISLLNSLSLAKSFSWIGVSHDDELNSNYFPINPYRHHLPRYKLPTGLQCFRSSMLQSAAAWDFHADDGKALEIIMLDDLS